LSQQISTNKEILSFQIGDFRIDLSSFEVKDTSEAIIHVFSKREVELLKLFKEKENKVISRDEILDEMVDEYVISKGFQLKSVDKTPNEFEDKGSVDFRREYVFDVDTLPFICDMVIQKYEDDWWLIECFIPLKTSIKLRDLSSQVNSRRWVCQGIEGLELCLQNLFKLID
jgi:hypothetical protein